MSDDLPGWPELVERVAPLPGGLVELRRKLRDEPPRRHRAAVAVMTAASACVIAALAWQLARPSRVRGDAFERLLDQGEPHPELVLLGIVEGDGARPDQASDPRVADDEVVFRWVRPSEVAGDAVRIEAIDPPAAIDPASLRDPR